MQKVLQAVHGAGQANEPAEAQEGMLPGLTPVLDKSCEALEGMAKDMMGMLDQLESAIF